ncbi:MAG: flagellar basal body L-ring protein FlgH [Geminicoccaceae bacterium]
MRNSRTCLIGLSVLLAGCNLPERVANIGRVPPLSPIENPTQAPGYQPVSLPMPAPEPLVSAQPNSLWRTGAKGFFRDLRARRVGDVLTVSVVIDDKAQLDNESRRQRDYSDGVDFSDFFGIQNKLNDWLPSPVDPSQLVNIGSALDSQGKGNVDRKEQIVVNVAAVITQVLPNGNLVLEGKQEVRVNYEVREVLVHGVIRPEDITPRNTIPHDKIAELRVSYGGRGQISDVQQPRYGAQLLDMLLPY